MAEHILAPKGSLLMAQTGQAFRDFEKIPANSSFRIDLSGVDRIDSSAVAWLVTVVRTARTRGQSVEIDSLPPRIIQFAEIYGLDDAIRSLLSTNR